MCHSPLLKVYTFIRLIKVRFQNVDFMCKHFIIYSHCFNSVSTSQLPIQKLNSAIAQLLIIIFKHVTLSTGCCFATIVAGFSLEVVGQEMYILASAVNSLFYYGSVFTVKVAMLLIRALVPLSELDLVSALSLTLLLMIMMACLHVVWLGRL